MVKGLVAENELDFITFGQEKAIVNLPMQGQHLSTHGFTGARQDFGQDWMLGM